MEHLHLIGILENFFEWQSCQIPDSNGRCFFSYSVLCLGKIVEYQRSVFTQSLAYPDLYRSDGETVVFEWNN